MSHKLTCEQMEAAFYLVATDLCFVWIKEEGGPFVSSNTGISSFGPFEFGPNLNDTFAYACADTEEIPWDELVPLCDLVKTKPNYEDQRYCLVNWAARKNDMKSGIPQVQEKIEAYRKKYPLE